MELLINIKIPKKLIREMNVYRKKYHPSRLLHLPAHITLVPPFIFRGKFTNLVRDMEGVTQSQRSFRMSIGGLGSFKDDVLFFKPDCPPELRKIHTFLKKIVWENYRQRRHSRHDRYWRFKVYRPHVTIASDKPENIRRYRKELKGFKYKRQFNVIGIGLYVRRTDKKWVLKKEFLFGRM